MGKLLECESRFRPEHRPKQTEHVLSIPSIAELFDDNVVTFDSSSVLECRFKLSQDFLKPEGMQKRWDFETLLFALRIRFIENMQDYDQSLNDSELAQLKLALAIYTYKIAASIGHTELQEISTETAVTLIKDNIVSSQSINDYRLRGTILTRYGIV